MKIYECLTNDDRYSVSQLSWLMVADLDRAREFATRDLMSDVHHRSVEVREQGRLVLRLDRESAS